ncbi:MAG: BrnT family toxin [Actinomycetota bacterium]
MSADGTGLRIRSAQECSKPRQARNCLRRCPKPVGNPDLIEVVARPSSEARYAVIGRMQNVVWTAIFTYRGGKVRLISVRRARSGEVRRYEGQ